MYICWCIAFLGAKRPVQITWPVRLSSCPPFHLFTSFQRSLYWIVPYYKSCVKSWDVTVPNYKRSFRGLQCHRNEIYPTLSPVTRVESSSYFTVPDSIPCVKGWEVTIRNYTWESTVLNCTFYIPCVNGWEGTVLNCTLLYPLWPGLRGHRTWLYLTLFPCQGLRGHRNEMYLTISPVSRVERSPYFFMLKRQTSELLIIWRKKNMNDNVGFFLSFNIPFY